MKQILKPKFSVGQKVYMMECEDVSLSRWFPIQATIQAIIWDGVRFLYRVAEHPYEGDDPQPEFDEDSFFETEKLCLIECEKINKKKDD